MRPRDERRNPGGPGEPHHNRPTGASGPLRPLRGRHQWAVEVSYLLTTAKPEGWQDLMDDLIAIEYDHGLIDADGEVTY